VAAPTTAAAVWVGLGVDWAWLVVVAAVGSAAIALLSSSVLLLSACRDAFVAGSGAAGCPSVARLFACAALSASTVAASPTSKAGKSALVAGFVVAATAVVAPPLPLFAAAVDAGFCSDGSVLAGAAEGLFAVREAGWVPAEAESLTYVLRADF
jgi:hypothetical protein